MSEKIESASRKLRKPIAAAVAVVAMVAAGCGKDAIEANNKFSNSCDPADARPLPLVTNILRARDNRQGYVYSCHYMLDQRIPFNTPTKLLKASESNVQSSSFQMSGDLGGLVLLGTGAISGDVNANGESREKRITALTFEDDDKSIRTILVDTDKTRVRACPEVRCEPTVTFNVSPEPLWALQTVGEAGGDDRFTDNSSIWVYIQGMDYTDGDNRRRVVSMLALDGPTDQGSENITGGPDTAGQVVSTLSTSIVLELPASVING